ncbi:hypothetical protein [Pantoea sp. RHCKP32]|uniref:hypothetical protein n=1 Tax=Pantoea sp. RHCKP32 TaxID=3425182 RepID=UPI003DA0C793
MQEKIDLIKNNVEKLKINDLKTFLEMELNEARLASKNSEAESNLFHALNGTEQNHYFDKLAFFIELTKDFQYSITDCDDRLIKSQLKYIEVNEDIENGKNYFQSWLSLLQTELEGIIRTLTDGSLFDNKEELPLYECLTKLKLHDRIDFEHVKKTIEASNFSPRGINKLYNKFYVTPGYFEDYATHRSKALALLKEFDSDEFKKKNKELLSQIKRKERLEKIPFKIRSLKVSWRTGLMDCFNIKYNEHEINPNCLLIHGNC